MADEIGSDLDLAMAALVEAVDRLEGTYRTEFSLGSWAGVTEADSGADFPGQGAASPVRPNERLALRRQTMIVQTSLASRRRNVLRSWSDKGSSTTR